MAPQLFLLSSSRVAGGGYLEFARDAFREFLGDCHTVYFAPFAIADYDRYTSDVAAALESFDVKVIGLHTVDAAHALKAAEVLFVGGGNSFRLLKRLQQLELIELVQQRVRSGALRYIGASAGSNMACPSLRTTNDMPIVQPSSFSAFDLLPFQINPHYADAEVGSTHMGETRDLRLQEFLEENDVHVLGMREGSWLRRTGAQLSLGGVAGARLFSRSAEPVEVPPGTDLSWLLDADARFDVSA